MKKEDGREQPVEFPAAELVAELLPAVLAVSARVHKALKAILQGGSGAAVRAVADPCITPHLCMAAYRHVTKLLLRLVELSHTQALVTAADTGADAAAINDAAGAAVDVAAAGQDGLGVDIYHAVMPSHLCNVLSTLECFVRSAAQSSQHGSSHPAG